MGFVLKNDSISERSLLSYSETSGYWCARKQAHVPLPAPLLKLFSATVEVLKRPHFASWTERGIIHVWAFVTCIQWWVAIPVASAVELARDRTFSGFQSSSVELFAGYRNNCFSYTYKLWCAIWLDSLSIPKWVFEGPTSFCHMESFSEYVLRFFQPGPGYVAAFLDLSLEFMPEHGRHSSQDSKTT